MTTFEGGVPIIEDGQIIGAIGVIGGHDTQVMECADAAVAVLRA